MQTPTCKNVRIRSIQDVHKIFSAVQRGWLKMITRRLDADERMALCSGCIYVWEERGPNTEVTGLGMERFTEGRRWSPSRVRDDFLFYFEQYSGGDINDSQPPRDWDPLIKQTYSALVQTERGPRKWHLTAYYTEKTVDNLGNIDALDGMKDLFVAEGTYVSQKSTKTKKEKGQKRKTTVTRKYAGFPPTGVVQEQPSTQPVRMFDPYTANEPHERNDPGTSMALQPAFAPPAKRPLPENDPEPRYQVYPQLPPEASSTSSTQIIPHTPSQHASHNIPRAGSVYNSPAGYPSPGSSTSSSSSSSSPRSLSRTAVRPSDRHAPPPVGWYNANSEQPSEASASDKYHSSAYHSFPLPVYEHHLPNAPSTSSAVYHAAATSTGQTYDHRSQRSHEHQHRASNSGSLTRYDVPEGFQTPPSPVSDDGQPRRSKELGPCRDLAPLHLLKRKHPYRRDPMDDKALRKLDPRPAGPPETP